MITREYGLMRYAKQSSQNPFFLNPGKILIRGEKGGGTDKPRIKRAQKKRVG
jgi:hypothetical protein